MYCILLAVRRICTGCFTPCKASICTHMLMGYVYRHTWMSGSGLEASSGFILRSCTKSQILRWYNGNQPSSQTDNAEEIATFWLISSYLTHCLDFSGTVPGASAEVSASVTRSELSRIRAPGLQESICR